MQGEIKDKIKSEIKAKKYIAFYLGNSTNGKWHCPFHSIDKTPSLSSIDFGFNCFACGEKGDIFTFVQKLFNIEYNEATNKVMRDFGYSDTKPTWEERQRAMVRKQEELEAKQKKAKDKKHYTENANLFRILNRQPKTAELAEYLEKLEQWLDDNLMEVISEFE
jgi:DNA primase